MQMHATVADRNQKCLYSFWIASRWLALRLDFVSNAVVVSVSLIAVIIVSEGGSVNPTTLGLALVYSLQMASFLQWTVRCAIETENNMTAVERLLAFSQVPAEAPRELPNDPPTKSWPTVGAIVMRNLSLRYRPDLGLVLNDVTLDIPGRCKVGVCGRTGAGKCCAVYYYVSVYDFFFMVGHINDAAVFCDILLRYDIVRIALCNVTPLIIMSYIGVYNKISYNVFAMRNWCFIVTQGRAV